MGAARETPLPGLLWIESDRRVDERGSFGEVVRIIDLPEPFIAQVNHAHSIAGVLRGLHAERWDKLVWVTRGVAFAAVADLRPESPAFRAVFTAELRPGVAMYIPEGLANSYYTLEEVDYCYLTTAEYSPEDAGRGVRWDDPDLAIRWPFDPRWLPPILSERDRHLPTLRELLDSPLYRH